MPVLSAPLLLVCREGSRAWSMGTAGAMSASAVQTVKGAGRFSPASASAASSHHNVKCHLCYEMLPGALLPFCVTAQILMETRLYFAVVF